MKELLRMIKRNKACAVGFTPAYQSYFSAGDESEPFCRVCDEMLEEYVNFCPYCGQKLNWDVGSPWYYGSRMNCIKYSLAQFFKR